MRFVRLVEPQLRVTLAPSQEESALDSAQLEKLELLKPWWQKRLTKLLEAKPQWYDRRNELALCLCLQRLSGDFDGFFNNLNRVMELNFADHRMMSLRHEAPARYSRPLEGLPDRNRLVSLLAAENTIYILVNQATPFSALSPELRAKAKGQGWKLEEITQLAEYREGISSVKDGVLRCLLFEKAGCEAEALGEMDALARRGNLEAKLDALAFRFGKAARMGENEELLKALLGMERANMSAAELELLDGITLGEAMRNRDVMGLDSGVKSALKAMLARFTKAPSGQRKVSRLRFLYRYLGLEVPLSGRDSRIGLRTQPYRRLFVGEGILPEKNSEYRRLEKNFLERVKSSLTNRSASSRQRGLLQLVNEPNYRGFKEKALALCRPGKSRSYQTRIHYAQLCLAYKEMEKAEKILTTLKAERPYDLELEVLWLLSIEPERRSVFLDEASRTRKIAGVVNLITEWAGIVDEEEAFFDAYERLVAILEERIDEFSLGDSQKLFAAFKSFQAQTRQFEKRSLHNLSSPLPRLKEGEEPMDGDLALRVRQRKILLKAYGEMLRLRSVRGQVFQQIQNHREVLRIKVGNVEWILFELLKKEPVSEVDFSEAEKTSYSASNNYGYRYGVGVRAEIGILALQALLDSQDFTKDVLARFVHHALLSKKQGAFLGAILDEDEEQVESLLGEYQQELEKVLQVRSQKGGRQPASKLPSMGPLDFQQQWEVLLDVLLRSERCGEKVQELLGEALLGLQGEPEYHKGKVLRICELGSAEEARVALEAVADFYFPTVEMHGSYDELKAAGAIPSEVAEKIEVGTSLFSSLGTLPRAWISLLSFLKESERAIWLDLREEEIRSRLQRRLDVMDKGVFYDRLEAEGFGGYDGLALLGEERVSDSGEILTWLEVLMSSIKLCPIEGRTYWLKVSEDCREQFDEITYLEAFLAMRNDFKISDEGRQQLLGSVLESELAKLSGLDEKGLRGLANLVKRDFPDFEFPGASEKLERFLKELHRLPREKSEEKIARLIADEKRLRVLEEKQAMGFCSVLAAKGNVELAAEFWAAYLKSKTEGEQERKIDFKGMNFRLLARKPFEGTLDLIDSLRFVRLVSAALQEQPELARGITYTRDILGWNKELSPFSKYSREIGPSGLGPYLDEVLQREGVAEFDKRVMGAFLIMGNYSGRGQDISQELYRVQVEQSALMGHSPGIVEVLLALSQLEGEREREKDSRALEVVCGYLRDQEIAPDLRAGLASKYLSKISRDRSLGELADAEVIGIVLRDLLMRGSYGATGKLREAREMMSFLNLNLVSVPSELQREIYEGWLFALEEDAEKVLKYDKGSREGQGLGSLIFDFIDGGRHFPLPQRMKNELVRSFSGNLDMMQKLLRAGNEELFVRLLPEAKGEFRQNAREYSATTHEMREEIWTHLPEEHQVRLMCYLASRQDSRDWTASEDSAGHLQADRALAAAKLFVANPPEEQSVRLRAIDDLEQFVEALEVLMPLLSGDLKDDLPSLAKNHRGEVRFLLRWMKAGGKDSIQVFAPDSKKPLKMYSIREYEPALAELENLLAPFLSEPEKIRLKSEFAALREPRLEEGEEVVLPTKTMRLENAARYILSNPLPEWESEEENACVALLVKAGLDNELSQELMHRHAGELKEIDEASLLAMPPAERELFVFRLRASVQSGEVETAMKSLQAIVESEVTRSSRSRLLELMLQKLTLVLTAHIVGEEGEVDEKLNSDLKEVSKKLFRMEFVNQKMRFSTTAQRAVLFLAFATHCLGDDKAGFEVLLSEASGKGRQDLKKLEDPSRTFGRGETKTVLLTSYPLHFDGGIYQSEKGRPLRQLLFTKVQENSFAELLGGGDVLSPLELAFSLHLKAADVGMDEDDISLERGNIDLILAAVLSGDKELFLSLLPSSQEAFFEGSLSKRPADSRFRGIRTHSMYFFRASREGRELIEDLDFITDEFQRLHFEVFASPALGHYFVRDEWFGLWSGDAETEKKAAAILPESGPAREQVLAVLGGVIKPESPLAEAVVAQAIAEGFELDDSLGNLDLDARRLRLDTFFFGWNFAMHSDDWSVLDFQFQHESDDIVAELLDECACQQALFHVAGEPEQYEKVIERLTRYGIDRTDPIVRAWMELIALVAGDKTSPWREGLTTLRAEQHRLAQAEMSSGLRKVLSALETVEKLGPVKAKYRWSPTTRSKFKNVWESPQAKVRCERVFAAIVKDESKLFSAAGISVDERVDLLLDTFDWQQNKSLIEEYFDGERAKALLIQLALVVRTSEVPGDDFPIFLEKTASQSSLGSREGSQLWFKVAKFYISKKNLEGAKTASEKINPDHLEKDYEFRRLSEQLRSLEATLQE